MGLDYPYTCSQINMCAVELTSETVTILTDMMDECCPLLTGTHLENFIKSYVDRLTENTLDVMEKVRAINSDMRTECDRQIEKLEDMIYDLKGEKDELQEEFNRLISLRDEICE